MLVSVVGEAVARLVYVQDCLALVGENKGSKLRKVEFILEIRGGILFALKALKFNYSRNFWG